MAPYSMDLRTRVLRDSDAGMPSKDVARKYAVSRAWVDRVKQRRRETGEITPRKQTTFRPRVLAGYEDRIVLLITARPDATLAELRDGLRLRVGLSTLWREIDRLGFRVKKNGRRRRTAAS
jgi:transposase